MSEIGEPRYTKLTDLLQFVCRKRIYEFLSALYISCLHKQVLTFSFFIMRMRDQCVVKKVKRFIKEYIKSKIVKFYWILCQLPNARHPKEKKMRSRMRDSFSVHNKISSAWKQQYILYYLDWNRFRIGVGENWQAFLHMNLTDNIADFIILKKKKKAPNFQKSIEK